MAQAGYTPIQLYYSTTVSQAPSAGNLNNGELAINITDGKLYYKDNLGAVQVIATTSAARLTVASGKTPTINNSITFSGTDSTTMTFPSTTTTLAGLGIAQTFTQDQTIAGNLTLNGQGDVRFADSDSSNWVAFQGAATIASNVTWTLPSADGTNGQVLTTNGTGTLSWSTSSGGISTGKSIAMAMIFGF